VTASTSKSRVRRERRIIERPRLIKLLDESEARIILLLAPAGYGKTTLARQWAKTLSGAIWVTLTPAHRDVVTLADDLASGVEAHGGDARRFIGEYLRAQSNPQRAAVDVAKALAEQMNDAGVQWLILDDHHVVQAADEIHLMMPVLEERLTARMLIATRERPPWLNARRVVYGELLEVTPNDLAMTPAEAEEMLGRRDASGAIAAQARGWPAVIGLAASLELAVPPAVTMPTALYQYLAEELFHSAPSGLRADLFTLALLPDLTPSSLVRGFGSRMAEVLGDARAQGFVTNEEETYLHPLLREFLFLKLSEELDVDRRVRDAIATSVNCEAWDNALELVLRFRILDKIDDVTEAAYSPLVRAGRLGTLSTFAASLRSLPDLPTATVDLVEAEVALRDGYLELAAELATRAVNRFREGHTLSSRANAIRGHAKFLLASYDDAESAFAAARATASDSRDEGEAIHGLALARTFGERAGADEAIASLARRRHESPTALVQFTTDELNFRRFHGDLRGSLGVDEALHTLSKVDDPRARTSLTYTLAYTLGIRAEYEEGFRYVELFLEDARKYDLEFALPFANWTIGLLALGLRRFGQAERAIQAVEDAAALGKPQGHDINARSLRARLLLQLGRVDEALEQVRPEVNDRLIPSWLAEYLATRALALACSGHTDEAKGAGHEALARSRVAEVRQLCASVAAVSGATTNDPEPAQQFMRTSAELGVWDPFVCAVRSSPALAELVATIPSERATLEIIYRRSNDRALARAAGFRTRETRSPDEVLSPREMEVLGLIARGFRNRDISKALFIADSTTKVHVRHILEKLGVRTRAEAVARYEMFAARRATGS